MQSSLHGMLQVHRSTTASQRQMQSSLRYSANSGPKSANSAGRRWDANGAADITSFTGQKNCKLSEYRNIRDSQFLWLSETPRPKGEAPPPILILCHLLNTMKDWCDRDSTAAPESIQSSLHYILFRSIEFLSPKRSITCLVSTRPLQRCFRQSCALYPMGSTCRHVQDFHLQSLQIFAAQNYSAFAYTWQKWPHVWSEQRNPKLRHGRFCKRDGAERLGESTQSNTFQAV